MEIRKFFKVLILCFLGFNLLWIGVSWPKQKRIIEIYRYGHEYKKIRVFVDSIQESRRILVNSGSDIIIYTAYYKNPKGEITLEDDTYYLFRPKNEKPNIEQFLEYYEKHNDSIYVWYHPILKDRYAKIDEVKFSDSFDLAQVILNSFLFITSILTILYLIIKKLLKK